MAAEVTEQLEQLSLESEKLWTTGLVYDELMTKHQNPHSPWHPESPERILQIWETLESKGYVKRCKRIPSRRAEEDEIALQHKKSYVELISSSSSMDADKLQHLGNSFDSIYMSQHSYKTALLSLGCTLALTQAVIEGKVRNGMAVVRPPGHHAEHDCAKGFCFFNNVAIAAKWAQTKFGVKKVLIVDWDVHHGNGIQHMFDHDSTVLYFSAHRYDRGKFYPGHPDGNYDAVGKGKGAGYNINVAWNKIYCFITTEHDVLLSIVHDIDYRFEILNNAGMHDGDYLAAFHNILMPVSYEFCPDLVLVSCGFDAAQGDPLGRCCLTPTGYSHLLHKLMSLANGRVVVVLEGGYNLTSIANSAAACVSTLLGDPLLELNSAYPSLSALDSIRNTLKAHLSYWKCLGFMRSIGQDNEHTPLDSDDRAPRKANILAAGNDECQGTEGVTATAHMTVSSVTNDLDASEEDAPAAAAAMAASCSTSGSHSQTIGDIAASIGVTDDEITMYAVTPLTWCPHLPQVCSVPDGGLNVDAPCEDCGDVKECWVCLHCYKVLCGRFVHQHMLAHSAETDHQVVLSYSDLSVWCYGCDSYVHHASVYPAKQAAHFSKFNEPMPE